MVQVLPWKRMTTGATQQVRKQTNQDELLASIADGWIVAKVILKLNKKCKNSTGKEERQTLIVAILAASLGHVDFGTAAYHTPPAS